MDDLIDFEALIDLKGLIPTMADEMNQSTDQESSQEPLENVLDKMCESLDADIIEISCKSIDDQADDVALDTVVDLDEFNYIFDKTCGSKDFKHVDDLVFNEEENENKITIDEGSNTHLNDLTDIMSDDVQFVDDKDNLKAEKHEMEAGDGTDLKEFEAIFNETCAQNSGLGKLEHKDSIFCGSNFAKLDLDVNHMLSGFCHEPKLDEVAAILKYSDDGATSRDYNNKHQIDSYNQNIHKSFMTPLLAAAVSHTSKDLQHKENLDDINSVDFDVNNSQEVKVEFDSNHKHEHNDADISKSSEESFVLEYSDDTDDGYNSSDFEFISESEAQKEGLVFKSKLKLKDPGVPVQNATKSTVNTENRANLIITDPNHDFIKYHRNRFRQCRVSEAVARRKTHTVPEGESFLDLFRGIYSPIVVNNLYYMSNKNVMPHKSMSLTDGFGFDLPQQGSESAETKADAAESLKKIRFLYPDENRKRRLRRRRF